MVDIDLDRLYAVNAVSSERHDTFIRGEVEPDIPFGMKGVNCHVLHKCRKTFVQPKIIPPFHGHQITEPHMRQFVGDNGGNILAATDTGGLRISEQRNLAVGNQSPVFHSPGREVGQRHVVRFGQRVGGVKIFFVKFNRTNGDVEREVQAGRCLGGGRPYVHFNPFVGLSRLAVKFTGYPCQQVGTHSGGGLESRHQQVIFDDLGPNWHVAQYSHVLLGGQRHIESRLGFRFVNTREDFTGVMAFELRCQQFLLDALIFKITWIQTVHGVGDTAIKSDDYDMFTG